MRRLRLMLIAGLFGVPTLGMASMPGDSIGVKTVQGKAYVMYKITKGDNLSQIAREYGLSVSQIQEANGMSGVGLSVDQVILVPSPHLAAAKPAQPVKVKQHVIERGESLWAISQKYKVTVEQLQAWNGLVGTGVSAGQQIHVSDPGTGNTFAIVDKPAKVKAEGVRNTKSEAEIAREKTLQANIKQKPGRHIVRPGETLYGIARQYGMDTRELKKLNRLESATVKEGQELTVKAEMPANANQGKSLMKMIDEVEKDMETAKTDGAGTPEPVKDDFPELEVLTVKKPIMVAPEAKVELYTDKFSGKKFKRIEESGKAGPIEDLQTDQTKFYAFHKFLPKGSYLRVDYPAKGQSILVEVVNTLDDKDKHAVRLSAKCMDYLMIREERADVVLRYVVSAEK